MFQPVISVTNVPQDNMLHQKEAQHVHPVNLDIILHLRGHISVIHAQKVLSTMCLVVHHVFSVLLDIIHHRQVAPLASHVTLAHMLALRVLQHVCHVTRDITTMLPAQQIVSLVIKDIIQVLLSHFPVHLAHQVCMLMIQVYLSVRHALQEPITTRVAPSSVLPVSQDIFLKLRVSHNVPHAPLVSMLLSLARLTVKRAWWGPLMTKRARVCVHNVHLGTTVQQMVHISVHRVLLGGSVRIRVQIIVRYAQWEHLVLDMPHRNVHSALEAHTRT